MGRVANGSAWELAVSVTGKIRNVDHWEFCIVEPCAVVPAAVLMKVALEQPLAGPGASGSGGEIFWR